MKVCEEQNKILKVGIQDFHIVTNVLHVHMRRNAVMRTEFEEKMFKLEKAVKGATEQAVLAEKRASVASNKADAAAAAAKKK